MSESLNPALTDNIGFLLSISSARAVSAANAALEPLGLKARSFSVLTVIASTDGISQRALAEELRLDPSQIVGLVDTLEQGGLVERRPHPVDRRLRSVVPTPHGHVVLDKARTCIDATQAELFGDLDHAEQMTLRNYLLRIAEQNQSASAAFS